MLGKHWRVLKPGDIVDVVAPGYASKPEAIEGARQFLIKWGLTPRIPADLIKPHFMHAHDDEIRLKHLRAALVAEDSAAVWCLRGGYGSNRLIPGLNDLRAPRRAKLFVGISDTTSIHIFLQKKWKWATLHAPLLDRLGAGRCPPRLENEVRRLVFGKQDQVVFDKLRPLNRHAEKAATLRGDVVGGNLTVLQSTLGTPWDFNARGAFLFVEDLGERGYRVDRIFEQFRQAGVLDGCKALLLGDFLGGEEPETKKTLLPLVFRRWAEDLEIPVFSGLKAGHAVIQRPLPFRTGAVLKTGAAAALTIDSGGD